MTEIILADFRNFKSLLPSYFLESRQIEELIENEVETNEQSDTDLCGDTCQNTIIIDRPSFSNFAENKLSELAVSSSPKFGFGKRSKLILLISVSIASLLFLICYSVKSCIKRRRRRQERRQSVHFPLQKRPSDVSVVEVQLDSSAI